MQSSGKPRLSIKYDMAFLETSVGPDSTAIVPGVKTGRAFSTSLLSPREFIFNVSTTHETANLVLYLKYSRSNCSDV